MNLPQPLWFLFMSFELCNSLAIQFPLGQQMDRRWWLGVRDVFISVCGSFSMNPLMLNTICNCEDWIPSVNYPIWHEPWMVLLLTWLWLHSLRSYNPRLRKLKVHLSLYFSELHWKSRSIDDYVSVSTLQINDGPRESPQGFLVPPGRTENFSSWLWGYLMTWLSINLPSLSSAMVGLLTYHIFFLPFYLCHVGWFTILPIF